MSFFICTVGVCPMRAAPSHKSEQVSQLLFGEAAALIERQNDFVLIKHLYDGYEGWCQLSQLTAVDAGHVSNQNQLLASEWINTVTVNQTAVHVPLGSIVNSLPDFDISYAGKSRDSSTAAQKEVLIESIARLYLNSPYLWGGRSVFGVDCSGFCQVVYRFANIFLLRDAYQQATQGEAIGFVQEARCGDLAFFDNEAGAITHVGILLNAEEIIHASGKVRIDKIDYAGIVQADTGLRTHTLRIIKRYF